MFYKKYTQTSRGAFCCTCSVNFGLMRETAGVRLQQFPARESRKKRRRKIRRKTAVGRVFKTTFLVIFPLWNLDGSGKVLKLLCNVWKEVIFKSKDCTNDFESCDCLGDRCRRCYLWRMQEACRYIKEYGRYIKELVRNGGIIMDLKETRSPSPLSNYPFVVSLVLYFKNRRKLDNFNLWVSWYTSTSY